MNPGAGGTVTNTGGTGNIPPQVNGGATSTGGTGVPPQGNGGGAGEASGGAPPQQGGGTGSDVGGAGTGGAAEPAGPYDDRSGSFKMLAYSVTRAYRHDGSIDTGHAMLDAIAAEQGFEVVHAGQRCDSGGDVTYCQPAEGDPREDNSNALITAEGLKDFEVVFFINPTGPIFTPEQKQVFETRMRDGGAFAGAHAATDTENGWEFYSEVTGQYYNGHGEQNTPGLIRFEDAALDHPAVAGLPNPWSRSEEWYRFDQWQTWTAKPGFQIIGRLEDNQPIVYAREWGGFRSFYSAIGHDASVFTDPNVKKHFAGGIMWAARRAHLLK